MWDDEILAKSEVTEAIANSGTFKHEGYITNVQVCHTCTLLLLQHCSVSVQ